MNRIEYESQDHNEGKRCAALIVLQTDEVVESEVRAWLPESTHLYHTRIPNQPNVTRETLLEMGDQIPGVCKLLPSHAPIDVVAYCCTSGATMIGESVVEAAVQQVFPQAKVTNPLSAVKARLNHLGAVNIGILTPYIPSVTKAMADHLTHSGFNLVGTASFYEEQDNKVCRISSDSVANALRQINNDFDCDAIFASCTNLRTHAILDDITEELGVPIVSSNAALAWHINELGHS